MCVCVQSVCVCVCRVWVNKEFGVLKTDGRRRAKTVRAMRAVRAVRAVVGVAGTGARWPGTDGGTLPLSGNSILIYHPFEFKTLYPSAAAAATH